ncbi:MAG TPA: helix-turn-helix transcriptional regulator [Tepidisphaeraceae bacterium]|jgi:DNA-binding CsgD family transcriptional regulator|nr:helix-turn-helix transcriptional regulator [Tepidisphaeraceae bacterium]
MNRTDPQMRIDQFPALPLEPGHWDAVFAELRFSPQQRQVTELVLRGLSDKQIASRLQIRPPTVRTYLNRIAARTRTRGRMELAMHVLAISHRVTVERLSFIAMTPKH